MIYKTSRSDDDAGNDEKHGELTMIENDKTSLVYLEEALTCAFAVLGNKASLIKVDELALHIASAIESWMDAEVERYR